MTVDQPPGRSRRARWPLLLNGVGPLWGAEAAVAVCSIASVVISARLLGTTEYGVAAIAMSVPQLVYSILEARGGQASVKYVARYRERDQLDRARSVGLLGFVIDGSVGALALAISVAVSPWVASGLLDDTGKWVLVAGYAAGVFFRAPITASVDTLIALGNFRVVGILRTMGAATRLVVTIVALVVSSTVEALIVGYVIGMAAEAAAMLAATHISTKREIGGSVFRSGLRSLRGQRRELMRFIAFSDLAGFLRVLATQSDVVVLGALAPTAEVGIYRLARQLTVPVMSLITPVQSVLFARLSATYERSGYEAARREATAVGRRVGLPGGLLLLIGVPLAGPIIRLLSGAEYADAERPAQLLILLGVLWAWTVWVQPLMLAAGRVTAMLAATAAAAVTTTAGYFVLGTEFLGSGVALSRLIGLGLVGQVVMLAFTMRDEPARRVNPNV